MEERIEYNDGIVVTFTGEYPTIYVSGFFPCGATPQQVTRAKRGDSVARLTKFAKDDADLMVSGHIANCVKCKAARDAAMPPT